MRDNCAAMTHTESWVWTDFLPLLGSCVLVKCPVHFVYVLTYIDDQIQLHDYIFSQSFKWFIALNLNSEYIYRQYTGEAVVCLWYWPVWSRPNKE